MAIPKQRLWMIGGGVVLAALVLGAEREEPPRCEVEVVADVLNVRAAPGSEFPVVDRLRLGDTTEAEPVTVNGFRRLDEGRWAALEFLRVVEGSDCG